VQDITLDCSGWHIKRDVLSEIALTSSLKVSLASKLDGEESRDGNAFRYHAVQIQNGAEREIHGEIGRADGEIRAEISSPGGIERPTLPPLTLMPVAAVDRVIKDLRAKATLVPRPVFGAEGTGSAYLVDVKEFDSASLRPLPRAMKAVEVPAEKSWTIAMAFAQAHGQDPKPLFSMRTRIFDTGVLDRLTIDAGIAVITADLEALEMHAAPTCPEAR
jgi:hypothetical protein